MYSHFISLNIHLNVIFQFFINTIIGLDYFSGSTFSFILLSASVVPLQFQLIIGQHSVWRGPHMLLLYVPCCLLFPFLPHENYLLFQCQNVVFKSCTFFVSIFSFYHLNGSNSKNLVNNLVTAFPNSNV